MRIGFFTDSYRPYQSGVVRALETLKKELTRQGHEVFIFAPGYRRQEPEAGVFRFWSIAAPTFREFSLAFPFSFRLAKTVSSLGLELIHVHSPFLLGRLGARTAKHFNLPLVFTYHTLYDRYVHYFPFFREPTRLAVNWLTKNFCNACDLIVAPSPGIKELLLAQEVKKPLAVIPTGIELEAYTQTDAAWLRKNFCLSPAEKVLLFVGRLGKEKNLGFLLQSFAEVWKELPVARLVLVGAGPEKKRLTRQAEALGIAARVTFTGSLPHSRVLDCYAGADLFVFSSLTETQGLVIAEAKAAGLPAVAVDAFGVRDFVAPGEDGYLTPLNIGAFSQRIILLLKDEAQRQKLAQQAKNNARKLSSLETTRQLVANYQFLLAR